MRKIIEDTYLPKENLEKMISNKSSVDTRLVISPK